MTAKYLFTLFAFVTAGTACKTEQSPVKPTQSLVERGKLLAMTSACHDCHTPLKMGPKGPEPDFSREMSGHPADIKVTAPAVLPADGVWMAAVSSTMTAWSGPWGISFTRNLTPDKETGIGTWTKQQFIDTIRNGRHMGVGRPLLPPMPAAWYAHMSDDDLGALFAYLQSIPAIKNQVPEPIPPQQAAVAPANTEQVAKQ